MMKNRNRLSFQRFLMMILSLMLIIFLAGCTTVKVEPVASLTLPEKYEELSVVFEDRSQEQGLFLSYDNYRRLAVNIANMRAYETELEEVILSYNDKGVN